MMLNNEPGKISRLWMTMFGDKQLDDNLTENDIKEKLDIVVKFYEQVNKAIVTEDEYNQALRELFTKLKIRGMGKGTPVIDPLTYKPWLKDRKDIDFYYWNRFRTYLIETKCWNKHIVDSLDNVTNDILDLVGNPAISNHWKFRGLVMGDVQSGKTANYTALCNKAMDAGYRVIIILAGVQENLRQQTQKRLDKELVGLESQYLLDVIGRKLPIGVGEISSEKFVATFTSKNNDFDQKILNSLGLRLKTCTEPTLFVIKKQKQRLDYLAKWLYKFNADADGLIDEPMLLIDDEADNASVNTRDGDPTTINKCIRTLLALFTRSSYVGYTATPYANIFIDPDTDDKVLRNDLFPSDFIYPLRPPSNYIGNTAIFGDEGKHDSMLVEINDAEECIPLKHKNTDDINGLPVSLYEAMKYFLLVNAVMDAGKEDKNHRTMMVNVSRLTVVHEYILITIKDWLDEIKNTVLSYAALEPDVACKIPDISELKKTWDKYKLGNVCRVDWKTLQQKFLYNAIRNIDAIQVNQRTKAASLDYDKFGDTGYRVIAIGGNSLSRGLTLEGLCVSYFYRNSRMYDTLLQMGRWFGYRDGYESLCKIWMSDEAIECYSHITKATVDLKNELQYMYNNNMTPNDFGLMIRSKPEVVEFIEREREKKRMKYNLIVTDKNKMKTATEIVRVISVRGELLETPKIPNKIDILLKNFENVKNLLSQISQYQNKNKSLYGGTQLLWENVPAKVVADFIREFSSDPLYSRFQAEYIADFIERTEELKLWDIAIPEGSVTDSKWVWLESLLKTDFKPQKRYVDTDQQKRCLRINGVKQRVGSKPCTKFGLDEKEARKIEDEVNEKKKNDDSEKGISDKSFLMPGRNPLLLVHLISMHHDPKDTEYDKQKHEDDEKYILGLQEQLTSKNACLVALGLGIPYSKTGSSSEKVRYVINKLKMQQLQEEIEAQNSYDD